MAHSSIICGGKTYYISCNTYTPAREDMYANSSIIGVSPPPQITHAIDTDYQLSVFGAVIPIWKTTRRFNLSWGMSIPSPKEYFLNPVFGPQGYVSCEMVGEYRGNANITDDLDIEATVLMYLNIKDAVAVYRKTTGMLRLDISSIELCKFHTDNGNELYNLLPIVPSGYTATLKHEFICNVAGVETIVSSETEEIHPFGAKNGGTGMGQSGMISVNPEIRMFIVAPNPPSKANIIWPDEFLALSHLMYDYGNMPGEESARNAQDGGFKDYYYPSWARYFPEDPLWRAAADRRYDISWFQEETVPTNVNYVPPAMATDPLPRGNAVSVADIGRVYQFLYEKNIISSHDFRPIVEAQLKDELKKTGDFLCFPIGVL